MGPRINADPFNDDTSGETIAETLREVHESRSERAQALDESQDAQLTTNPQQWADDPDEYDYPGIDTGPTFERENEGFDTGSFIEDFR